MAMGERIPAAAPERDREPAPGRAPARAAPAPAPELSPPPRRRNSPVSTPDDVQELVPKGLRVSAAIGWRLLVVVAALVVVGYLAGYLASVVVPVAIALLLSALLAPLVALLHEHGVPRGFATAIVLIGGLAVLGGVLTFVVVTFVRGVPDLGAQLN